MVGDQEYVVTVTLDDAGKPNGLLTRRSNLGWLDPMFAVASMALQRGTSMARILRVFQWQDFPPHGTPEQGKSVLDAIARKLVPIYAPELLRQGDPASE